MKKKLSPGVLLTAFALSVFISISLRHLQAQVSDNDAGLGISKSSISF